MPYELESRIPEVLHRWIQSGAPLRWVEAHQGQWSHHDWLELLAALHRGGQSPVSGEQVGWILEETRKRWQNLQRWARDGGAVRWVDAQRGHWDHQDWTALLDTLDATGYGPVDHESLGHLLEQVRLEWWNLQRWRQSGQPRHWVEIHGGQWHHHDWVALLDLLRRSEFWPLNTEQVGRLLEDLRDRQANLRRWQESGEASCWVESHNGRWNHQEWLLLLQGLQLSEYAPLDPEAIGQVVEEARKQYLNLERWVASEDAWRWVEEHQGQSSAEDLRALVRSLHHSEFWPLDAVSLAASARQLEQEWVNQQRWQTSGEPRRWVEDHQGRWGDQEREALLAQLSQSSYWPLNVRAVEGLLERIRLEWWNLRRWQQSGLARRWLEKHRGGRAWHDWQALLETLRQSDFWPMEMEALRQVVENFRPTLTQAA